MVAILTLVLTLPLLTGVQAEQSVLRGSWAATVGQQRVLQGTWAATIQTATPDAAQGTWTLLDKANRVVLQGTWSAEKSPKGWHGTWAARVASPRGAGGRTASGQSYTGTWQASSKIVSGRTFAEMFEQTLRDQISGSWRSGRLQGNWSLRGFQE